MSSLSEYNFNPGNLRPPKGVTYDGQIGVDDNGFAVFENAKKGREALISDIKAKIKDQKLNTPEAFIDKYTPASGENNADTRDNYKLYLAQQMGLNGTNEPFPENAHEKLADAIAAFEGGTWNKPKEETSNASTTQASPLVDKGNNDTLSKLGSGTWSPGDKKTSEMPMWEQSLVGGGAGALFGGGLGLTPKVAIPFQLAKDYLTKGKLPPTDTRTEPTLTEPPAPTTSAWPGKQTPATVKPITTPITPETITAEMEKQVQPRSRVEKAIHGLVSGEEAEGPGRERSTGFAETTGQMAARKREQARTGSQLNLNTDRPLAEFPDVAPAPGGYSIVPKTVANELADQAKIRADLATKQAQADAVQRIQATNAARQSGMKAASTAGSQWQDTWQKMTEHAQNLANSPNEAERAVANSFLAKAKDVWSKGLPINQSLVAQGATLLGSVGASIPEAWKQHQEKNDVGAAQTLGTGLGVGAALASVPAKVLPGLSAVGQGVEAVQRGQQGDVPGAIVSGLGSLASVAPYAAPAVAGALGTAALPVAAVTAATAPFVNALRDRIKANQAATPSQYFQPPTQEELTQASQPAIVYPKP